MNPTNPVESWDQVYASQSSYVQPPSAAQALAGVVPLDTLPADWWNSLLYKLTKNQNATAAELTDIMNEMISVLMAADIPPSSQSSQQLLNAIRKVSRTIATASTAGAVISSNASGKVSVDPQGVMTPNGLGVPSNLNTIATDVVSAINELYSTLTNYIQTNKAAVLGLQNGKAPTNHASDQTTYGAGSSTNYGHVKLSDAINSTAGTGDGVAATPAAVKAVADVIAQIQLNTFNQMHPIGESYIQLPLTKTPNELWGQWSKWAEFVGFNGAFFRSRNIPSQLYSIDGSSFYNDVNRTEPIVTSGCGTLTYTGQTAYDSQGNVVKIYTAGTAAGKANAFIGEGGTLSAQGDTIKQTSVSVSGASHSHGGATGVNNRGHTHTYTPSGNIGSTSDGTDNKVAYSNGHRHGPGPYMNNNGNPDGPGDTYGAADFFYNRYGRIGSRDQIFYGLTSSTSGTNKTSTVQAMTTTSTTAADEIAMTGYAGYHTHNAYFKGAQGTTNGENQNHTHTISSSGSLSMSGTIGSGNAETRPTNFTIRLWKRIS